MFKKIFFIIILVFNCFVLNVWVFAFGSVWEAVEARENANESVKNDISWDRFEIKIWDITPWNNSMLKDENGNALKSTSEVINKTLWTIIQRLMIGLGSMSLIIMTIGWGYMIIYHGQDELLSKWKYIFMSWIIALVVALSSYYIVSLLRYVLYA